MKKQKVDASTEQKIKLAAKEVFHRKGYAATRTRDIAEASGINLALLNYYFRSKEKLFQLIMMETMQQFITSISGVFNDPKSTLSEKIESIVDHYIEMLLDEPNLPIFIMSELRNHPDVLVTKLPLKELLTKSVLANQYKKAVESGKFPPLPFLQFIVNIISLTIFPFIGQPIISRVGEMSEEDFRQFVRRRKKMIPLWIDSMMNTNIQNK
jgi:AcrR family transcriptional regulator